MRTVDRKQLGSTYEIRIKQGATCCERYAAEELQRLIFQCLRVRLEIAEGTETKPKFFSLGKTSAREQVCCSVCTDTLRNDGFVVFVAEENIYLDAATSRGILYAVYEYAERYLGFRFLTAECTHIPRRNTLPIPESERVSVPAFSMRCYLAGEVYQTTADMKFAARTRSLDVFTPVPEKFGGSPPVYGRNVPHNFHYYVPFEIYGNDHPEFYRFFYENGEIMPTIDLTNGITDDGKLDETMQVSVAKIVIQEMIKDLIAHPGTEVFLFTQEDGRHYYESERNTLHEKKFGRSGMLIRFCNVIVRELNRYAREHMNGKSVHLMTFAYDYAKEAPVREENGTVCPLDPTVVADEHLILQFALYSNGFFDYFSEKQTTSVLKIMQDWRCIAKRFWFWAYDIDFARYLGYFDSFGNIRKNLEGFLAFGIEYLCMQGPHDSCKNWQADLRGYVYRKMMWDMTLDADALMQEYIALYYGAGADAVREVMKLFHENYVFQYEKGERVTFYTRGSHNEAKYNPEEMLLRCVKLLDNAKENIDGMHISARKKKAWKSRLERVKATPLMLLCENCGIYAPGDEERKNRYLQAFCQSIAEGKIDMSGERTSIRQYLREIGGEEIFEEIQRSLKR